MVLDSIDSLEVFAKTHYSPPDTIPTEATNIKKERYYKQTFFTHRKEFNLFAAEGMDITMVMQALVDRYVK